MIWLLIEAAVALSLLILIVWWTMRSRSEPDDKRGD